jgi:hypothetical protein
MKARAKLAAYSVHYDCDRELLENHMALCPVCAAKYLNARTTPDTDMRLALEKGNVEIPVILAGKPGHIRFVNDHKNDLLSALGVLGDKRQRSA